mgnify:CR=1 FL=1
MERLTEHPGEAIAGGMDPYSSEGSNTTTPRSGTEATSIPVHNLSPSDSSRASPSLEDIVVDSDCISASETPAKIPAGLKVGLPPRKKGVGALESPRRKPGLESPRGKPVLESPRRKPGVGSPRRKPGMESPGRKPAVETVKNHTEKVEEKGLVMEEKGEEKVTWKHHEHKRYGRVDGSGDKEEQSSQQEEKQEVPEESDLYKKLLMVALKDTNLPSTSQSPSSGLAMSQGSSGFYFMSLAILSLRTS